MLKSWISSSLLCCLVWLPQTVLATSKSAGHPWELNGFITQGYFNTDHYNVSGESESGSFDFREIGLNGSWNPARGWLVAAQLMSRRMGEVNDGDPRVDYAVLDYRFTDQPAGYFGTRLGRVKIPYGLYNDTRDVAFTRPSILLPQSIYLENTRNILLSADGVMLYGSRNFATGSVDSELLAGYLIVDTELEEGLLGFNAPGELKSEPAVFWRLMYRTLDQGLILGSTLIHAGIKYDVAESGDIFPEDGKISVNQFMLSAQYNLSRWSFTSEYLLQESQVKGLGMGDSLPANRTDAIYLQAEYRLTPKLNLFLRRELGYSDRDDRNGKQAALTSGRPAHHYYNRDWAAGIGWTPNRNWLLRAELHHVKGTSALAPPDNPDPAELEQDWNLLALQATYRF